MKGAQAVWVICDAIDPHNEDKVINFSTPTIKDPNKKWLEKCVLCRFIMLYYFILYNF